ncbi:MAG: hypothetical protein JRG94_27070, partial [Deltaproteobacteria bacterium]|nr:hypothetical protein [Deltaproteobacteria bacterium]
FKATSLPRAEFEDDPYIAHFPDGNASIARLLVRAMIPRVANGSTMQDIVGARFDYTRLDEPSSRVRMRLASTVVRVEHDGPPDSADRVAITYVRGGRAARVWARSCVLAGYNAMIPYLCPELPKRQREALALAVKVPILYSTVLLRNWRAWKEIGIAAVSAPGSYHANAMLDFPVSFAGYEFSANPDDPIAVHMERFGNTPGTALTPREQFRAERHRMLATPFSQIERELRSGAGHRGDYGQPLGARIRQLLQPSVRFRRWGGRAPARGRPGSLRANRGGELRRRSSGYDRLGDRPGASRDRGTRRGLSWLAPSQPARSIAAST